MHKLLLIIQFLVIFVPIKAYSFSSSSYLIANSAISFFDYDEANFQYDGSNLNYFNESDLEKKLLAYVNTNSLNKASKVAEKILKNDRTNQEAWLVYLIYAKLHNLDKPFNDFQKQEQKEDFNNIKLIFYNDYQLKKNNDDIAESILDIVQSSISEGNRSFYNYDYILFYLSLSLNLDKNFNEAYFLLAQIYQNINNYSKAEKFYNKVNSNHSLYLESQINIARNNGHEENIDKAEQDLIFLLKSNPSNESVLIALSDLYRSTKQYNKAIPYYSKILNDLNINEDQKWRLLYMRGICYERMENWKSAEDDFLKSLEINSNSAQVLNYLAYGWIERNINLDRSLKMLKFAHEENPESHYILDSLAWAHFKKNNLIIASKLMEEVITKAPGEAISLDHLGDIYFSMGRKREASYMWRQAKDLAKPEDRILDELSKKLEKYYAG